VLREQLRRLWSHRRTRHLRVPLAFAALVALAARLYPTVAT